MFIDLALWLARARSAGRAQCLALIGLSKTRRWIASVSLLDELVRKALSLRAHRLGLSLSWKYLYMTSPPPRLGAFSPTTRCGSSKDGGE